MNADGTNPTRLTRSSGWDGEPAWSADGWSIAFSSSRDGNYEIYAMRADGTNVTPLTTSSALDVQPDWQTVAPDRTPPTLTPPEELAVDATGPSGAVISYTVTVRDDVDPAPALVCAPPSGTTFAIGDTTVACTATDASGNSATASFTVHVRGAVEQLRALEQTIAGFGLKHGLGSDLQRYLNLAVKYVERGQTEHARQQLRQFLATVERTAGKDPPWLTPAQATTLTNAGRRILAVLG
jgi:hypothetical protein